MKAYERLLSYVKVFTPSSEETGTSPSTQYQFDLARLLVQELKELGVEDADVDEHCYVYGHIPATRGYESRQKLGFIAHMDTVSDPSSSRSCAIPIAVGPFRAPIRTASEDDPSDAHTLTAPVLPANPAHIHKAIAQIINFLFILLNILFLFKNLKIIYSSSEKQCK